VLLALMDVPPAQAQQAVKFVLPHYSPKTELVSQDAILDSSLLVKPAQPALLVALSVRKLTLVKFVTLAFTCI